jgi:uncharacterized protein with von Willebrand factor type A (vWA) domain
MELQVKRTFSTNQRFRYELMHQGRPVKKVLSDNEYLYAVVTTGDDPSMALRRTVSEITTAR